MSNTKNLECKCCNIIVENVGKDVTGVTCSTCVSKQLLNLEIIELDKNEEAKEKE